MCKSGTNPFETLALQSSVPLPDLQAGAAVAAEAGSRRKRLWELDALAHCPILGVCLPLGLLRKVVDKALEGRAAADDYELHCSAAAACKHRNAVAEAVQRELDRRYRLPLQQAARLKTAAALTSWWDESLSSGDFAGVLWATLTHPRCTVELARQIEGQVHMLQHQVGAAARVDHDRLDALQKRADGLARELAGATRRAHRQAQEYAHRIEALEATITDLRAQLSASESTVTALQELQAGVPELQARVELAAENARLRKQHHDQQRALLRLRQEAERQRQRAEDLGAELERRSRAPQQASAGSRNLGEIHAAAECADRLNACAVLCVGGRQASVPVYRQLIEKTGGRFLHHDGGEEHNCAKLDATLGAADLVICQTACVSHAAYWRVKEHCKRTGKRCIFVESPSASGFRKALMALVPAAAGSAVPATPAS